MKPGQIRSMSVLPSSRAPLLMLSALPLLLESQQPSVSRVGVSPPSMMRTLAPIRNGGEEKIISMFQVIEDIKKPTFEAAVPFSWETFGDYLDHIKPNLGINVGALIGHSAIRLYVMGQDSRDLILQLVRGEKAL